MQRALCKECAADYGKWFDLRAALKKEVNRCRCERCGKVGWAMLYEVKRRA